MAKATIKLGKFKMPLKYKIICKSARIATLGKIKISYKKHDDGIVLTCVFPGDKLDFLLKNSKGILEEWAKQNNISL